MADILNSPVQWDQLDRSGEPVRMRLSSTVVSVMHEGAPESAKGVVVTYRRDGKLYRVRARAAVLCSQQHVNRHICRDVTPEYREAMSTFHHAPMLTVNIAVRNWKFLEKLGISAARWFEGFGWWVSLRRNLEIPGQTTQPLDPAKPTVLTMYNPFPLPGVPFPEQCTLARMQLFNMSYAHIETAVREQFTKMFGDAGFDGHEDGAIFLIETARSFDLGQFFAGRDVDQSASSTVIPRHASAPSDRSRCIRRHDRLRPIGNSTKFHWRYRRRLACYPVIFRCSSRAPPCRRSPASSAQSPGRNPPPSCDG